MPHPWQNLNSSRDTFLLLGLKQQGNRERAWEMNKEVVCCLHNSKMLVAHGGGRGGGSTTVTGKINSG